MSTQAIHPTSASLHRVLVTPQIFRTALGFVVLVLAAKANLRVLEKFASHHVAESYSGLYRELMNAQR